MGGKIYLSLKGKDCIGLMSNKTIICPRNPSSILESWLPINFPKLLYIKFNKS